MAENPIHLIHLSSVKILSTGADGGHIYIKGFGIFPGEGMCDIYAYFRTKEQEHEFEKTFNGESVIVAGDKIDFSPSTGGAVRRIVSWQLA